MPEISTPGAGSGPLARPSGRSGRTLALRLDSAGDVLLAGPALRALANSAADLTLVVGPRGADVARLLPGVDRTIVWDAPWISVDPKPVDKEHLRPLVESVQAVRPDLAVIFTSFHQSALPTALLLRLAGVPTIAAVSDDYPGSLLDIRHERPTGVHEVESMLSLAQAAGAGLPVSDDGRLRVRRPLPPVPTPASEYVVLHPGTSAPARGWPVARWRELAMLLTEHGRCVVVTGSPEETDLTRDVAAGGAWDLGGRTTWSELAYVFARATTVVVGNTGPAHVAAAVGTPIVSLFAPTVPAERWAPYGVPVVLLGDQEASCRDSRALHCPVPGHPCLTGVTAARVADALGQTSHRRAA